MSDVEKVKKLRAATGAGFKDCNLAIKESNGDLDKAIEILRVKAPSATETLSAEVVGFVQSLRDMDLFKLPGVAETIDWAHALTQLDCLSLDPETVNDTLGTLLKYQDDIKKIEGSEANRILKEVKSELASAGA